LYIYSRFVPLRAQQSFEGHTFPVNALALSPDGCQILSGSRDETARLWDADSGKELRRFDGHASQVSSVAFSPDGRRVVTGSGNYYPSRSKPDPSDDCTVRVWDVQSGQELHRLEGHTDEVSSLAFSPDGRQILSGSGDKTVRLWDADAGREIRRFEGHTEWVKAVRFSPDGKLAVSGGADRTIRLWDIATGKELRSFAGPMGKVRTLAFSPDGSQVVSGHCESRGSEAYFRVVDYSVRLWDTDSGQEIRRFNGHSGYASDFAFSPDGRLLLSTHGSSVFLWEVGSGKKVRHYWDPIHGTSSESVAFSPRGRFALASPDGTIWLYELPE
jgi:WD40 repeat protein